MDEFTTFLKNYETMTRALDDACHAARDPPDVLDVEVSRPIRNGKKGRPRIEISLGILERAKTTPRTVLAAEANCTVRTLRKRLVEAGIEEPGLPPVHLRPYDMDRHPDPRARGGMMSMEQVVEKVSSAIEQFPTSGTRILQGHLRSKGTYVGRHKIQKARRIISGEQSTDRSSAIQRRIYNVCGPNSVWHNDGNHGESFSWH